MDIKKGFIQTDKTDTIFPNLILDLLKRIKTG